MRPPRHAYLVIERSWLGLPCRVQIFRTALDLHRIPGLLPRLKTALGGQIIRPLPWTGRF